MEEHRAPERPSRGIQSAVGAWDRRMMFTRPGATMLSGCLGVVFLSTSLARTTVRSVDVRPPHTLPVVTTVPFELERGFILIQAEVDGHRGTFVWDTGSP